ncbi:MAG: hypothetical protein JXR37_02630 [Kiritimatiellae bacterium]|nr:hypothetical protein [Kiritimatiellia bacterium]
MSEHINGQASAVCCLALLIAGAASAEVLKFDFGTSESIVRPGFTKVTPHDAFGGGKGYGFESIDGLLAFDRGGAEKKETKYGAERQATDLTADLIEGPTENSFHVALPDGPYTVWLIAGDPHWAPPLFDVWANGVEKLEVRLPRRKFVCMEPFEACAERGKLSLAFKGRHGWTVNGLVIGTPGEELKRVAADLERDIFFVLGSDLAHWRETPFVSKNPPLKLAPEETARGYVVFVREPMAMVYPVSIPLRAEIGRPVTAFATPGEFEPASFSVYPKQDLGAVAVELSDFMGERGERIGREHVEVGVVHCWRQRTSYAGAKGTYRTIPERIDPPTPGSTRINAGEVKQWWLTVRVPDTARPGNYRMRLKIRPEAAPPTELEWRLLVLPFRLSRPGDRHWGTWFDAFPPLGGIRGPARRGRNTKAEIDRIARAEMEDYRNHGFDTGLINFSARATEAPDGRFTYDISGLIRDMEYFKRVGSDAPVVVCFEYTCRDYEYEFRDKSGKHVPGTFSPKALKAVEGLVRYVQAEAERRNWPPLLYFPIDEPGNTKTKNRYVFAENTLRAVQRVPGCKTATTVNANCIQRLGDLVDVRIYAYPRYLPEKVRQEARAGHPFWYYNNGIFYGHSLGVSRGMTGFDFLKTGAETATAWGFAATYANPYNDFDGGHKDWNVVFPGLDKPIPTIYWEAAREGIDDCRYVATLQEQIARAKRQGKTTAAHAAEQVLAPIVGLDEPRVVNTPSFNRYRWRLAREILRLAGHRQHVLPFYPVVARSEVAAAFHENMLPNPGFENGPEKNGLPGWPYDVSDPFAATLQEPVGALSVTTEQAHSGKYSLKWDFGKAAGKGAASEGDQYLVVNVQIGEETAAKMRGNRVKVGMWVRVHGGVLCPGLRLRQFAAGNFIGDAAVYGRGMEDITVWNHFEAEGRVKEKTERLDIHLWGKVPKQPALAREARYYIDDLHLQVFDEPPLRITTELDEYYIGEPIDWTVTSTAKEGAARIALLSGTRTITEQSVTLGGSDMTGTFETRALKPGIYTLAARVTVPGNAQPLLHRRQLIVAPDPFAW